MTLTVLDVAEWFGDASGGIRTYLLAKGEYVRGHSHLRQVLVLPGAQDNVIDDGGVRTYSVRGPRVPAQSQYRFLFALRKLRRVIERERPDVIEVGSLLFAPWLVAMAARGYRAPRLVFYHENLERRLAFPRGAAAAWRELSRGPLRAYLRAVSASADAGVAASDTQIRDLADAGITGVARSPLGVDLQRFHPARRRYASATRSTLGVSTNDPVVAFAGRLAPEKELTLLLHAWRAIENRCSATLLVMGEGPLEQQVRRAALSGRVVLLPFQRDRAMVADILAAADLLVVPGTIETFGLAALEAMACGTPVVVPDSGGASELVSRSGAGESFIGGNADSLVSAVCGLLDDPVRLAVLGRVGRRYVEREHDWQRVFDDLFALYARLVHAETRERRQGTGAPHPSTRRGFV
ncbi:MAG TPA: glycosyltransferase [Gemmatimonadaceae bacterium]